MKGTLLAICIILAISTAAFSSDIKGTVSAIDVDGGTFEVCGVEVVTSNDWTIIEDRLKRPATLNDLTEGDYVEIEGRFIEPAKLEATEVTLGRVLASGPTSEIIEEDDSKKEGPQAEPEPEQEPTIEKHEEPAPRPTEPPPPGKDKLSGTLRNADTKTRILVVDGTTVNLEAGSKVLGANGKPVSLAKLRRGCRVECEGTHRSKKEFSARTVRVVK